MQLHFQSYGHDRPLVVLHGLFGSLENWHSISQKLADEHQVLALDQRNHGDSPQATEMSYQLMAADLKEFATSRSLGKISLLGHSMGAKTAMVFALNYPDMVEKLIVVDMAPRAYPPHHSQILKALLSLDLDSFTNRTEMEAQLAGAIPDLIVRRFLLKNVKRDSAGAFYWQMNLAGIIANYARLNEAISSAHSFNKKALFIRGERSDYIREEDMPRIRDLFPRAEFCEIQGAGHWVHADAPEPFLRKVREFLKQ
jgi:pimeloyl-ACP methyl ester carboxylesterase